MSSNDIKFNSYLIEKPSDVEVIIGQGNFSLKTAYDLAQAILKSAPQAKFGLAMNEASDKIVRLEGNDQNLEQIAAQTALTIGAGHAFFIFFKGAFPSQILPEIKNLSTVCRIYAATGNNPLVIFTAQAKNSIAIIGVGDGPIVNNIEDKKQYNLRYEKLKKFGFI